MKLYGGFNVLNRFESRRQELEIGLYDSRNFPKDLELAPEQLWEDYHFACSLARRKMSQSKCINSVEQSHRSPLGILHHHLYHFAEV